MSLSERIEADLKEAMKSGDAVRVSTLRLLRSELKNKEIASGGTLDDAEVERVIAGELKQRRESAESYRTGERAELAEKEEAEAEILRAYLPEPLSEVELSEIIDRVMASLGEDAQLGAVIGRVRAEVGSRAEGSRVARLVQQKLGS